MGEFNAGPLDGIRVLDMSALGPGPFATMMLADYGAEVIHVLRPDASGPDPAAFLRRGKSELVVDIRAPDGPHVIRRLADECDVLLEGNRPGAMERRGLGPDVLLARNPGLVYTRLTGWGQQGPYAQRAGHDINYLATSGLLGAIGTDEPVVPLAFLGDLASGSFMAVIGTILALFERQQTGEGQVVDASIVDGATLLLSAAFGERASGMWDGRRGTHLLSGTVPFYGVYECGDGNWYSVGAIEPQFYAALIHVVAPGEDPTAQWDTTRWPALRRRFAVEFLNRTRPEWDAAFAGVDACVAPVLGIDELDDNEHLVERRTVHRHGDRLHSGPAPRLSAHVDTTSSIEPRGVNAAQVLAELGASSEEIKAWIDAGVVADAS
ncbi:CaiB/BaiF CoA transferase family protein [Candidatus Poriferisocius sp.]|uniref:CaiB/BaiF CoA transferase family protein n=1 Tax=Candidatus Poriferisocius sp. TaxID=3101276 RepID=UPI003B020402